MTKPTEMQHPVSDRIMTMRIPLTKDRNFTIVKCICSNNGEPRGEQGDILQPAKGYTQKHQQYRQAPADRRLQCKDRTSNDKWRSALGKYGIGKYNSHGKIILAICTEFDLIVTNTMFKQKDANCGTDHQMLRSRVIFSIRKNTIRKEL